MHNACVARAYIALLSCKLSGMPPPVGASTVSLDQLSTRVADVYVKCGFDADASVSTLQMLTNIEMKLEEYLIAATGIPEEYIESMEKAREKERRKVRLLHW